MATDPYVYPGTNTLQNRTGTTNAEELQKLESILTTTRLSQLVRSPIEGHFDVVHLQRIHQHIFQDVYAWAGAFRTVDIGKAGEFWFCRPEFIVLALEDLFGTLHRENNLKVRNRKQFCSRAAYYLGELNAIHPFREGNGRAQREFIREVGLTAGFDIDWSEVTNQEMYSVSESSFRRGNNKPLEELLARITTASSSETR